MSLRNKNLSFRIFYFIKLSGYNFYLCFRNICVSILKELMKINILCTLIDVPIKIVLFFDSNNPNKALLLFLDSRGIKGQRFHIGFIPQIPENKKVALLHLNFPRSRCWGTTHLREAKWIFEGEDFLQENTANIHIVNARTWLKLFHFRYYFWNAEQWGETFFFYHLNLKPLFGRRHQGAWESPSDELFQFLQFETTLLTTLLALLHFLGRKWFA